MKKILIFLLLVLVLVIVLGYTQYVENTTNNPGQAGGEIISCNTDSDCSRGIRELGDPVNFCYNNQCEVYNYSEDQRLEEQLKCNKNSDCVVRVTNYNIVRACLEGNQECEKWGKIIEGGPPGHTEYPDVRDTLAFCDAGKCELIYDCSKCDELKKDYGDRCTNYPGGTKQIICDMYNRCNC